MPYFKDQYNNAVWLDINQEVDEKLIRITEYEASFLINPKPTNEQLTQRAKYSVYALLDQTAQQYDYCNFAEVAQFLDSGVWKAEAESLIAWQDVIWVKAYELLKAPITSVDDFVAQLPKYVPSYTTQSR
jgi:hypothetical protein